MIWKRNEPPPPPKPRWQTRIDEARALIRQHRNDPNIERQLDAIEQSVAAAVADGDRLDGALDQLRPEVVERELKVALRSRRSPTEPDTELIATLRRRHDSIHTLRNRRAALADRVEATLVDLDTFAVRIIELNLMPAVDPKRVDGEMERLQADVDALVEARREVDRL